MASPLLAPRSTASPEPSPDASRAVRGARIVVAGLTKRYGSLTAVDDLSFSVEPGRVTGFLGPNGAGKTTTLRMLLGLIGPDSGTATIGASAYADLPHPTRVVGAVLEASSAHRARTGRNHLRAICLATGLPLDRADEVLDLVGLTPAADRVFRGYSLGMQQRLGIATALLGDPEVLILDEPANGLDPEGIRWMRELLRGLARGGRTVLVSSHLLIEMQALADDVVILAGGRLVRQGSVRDVIAAMTHGQTVEVRTVDPDRLGSALTARGHGVQHTEDGLLVTGATEVEVGDLAHEAAVAIHHLATLTADLEDAFLELTHAEAAIR